jgi:hypothetical protein
VLQTKAEPFEEPPSSKATPRTSHSCSQETATEELKLKQKKKGTGKRETARRKRDTRTPA